MTMKTKTVVIFLILFFAINKTEAQYSLRNDSIINEAISLIDADSVESQLQWLQDMGTRFLMAPNHKEVSENIKARFESFGITEVRLDSFQCYTSINYGILQYDTTTWQYNVETKIIGSVYPDEEILLMGHHDNVQLDSDPEIFTPGADDNASGTVAALETARVLMQMGYQPERTVVFLTTAAEELMNFGDAGSEYYAAEAESSGRNIWGVINNDMIAYDNGSDVITFSNVIGSEEITGVAELITNAYTWLTPYIPGPSPNSGADLKPFINAGYHGVYLMESYFNPYYHSELDIVENCDLDYLTEAIKISCGMILYTDITVGVDELENKSVALSVYPNPCNDVINIAINGNTSSSQIMLINTTGQLLYSTMVPAYKQNVSIDMVTYPAGVYVLCLYDNNDITKFKIIKE